MNPADLLAHRYPRRATAWRLRTRWLDLPRRPLVMGIVNVTPDSFSDGGQFYVADQAIAQGLKLAAAGAELLDVGGESTRPYSAPVSAEEELRRVLPVVKALVASGGPPVSIDTSKALVAEAALAAGAEIINDVTAFEGDPAMMSLARDTQAGVCLMHMRGTPQTMQDDPVYEDVVREVGDYLRRRRDALDAAGIDPSRIALDPGIGFGKLHPDSLRLLREVDLYHDLGCPLLVGHSRKSFIGAVLRDKQADRTAGTVGVALALATRGVQLVRVHDVEPVKQALLLFEACGGIEPMSGPPVSSTLD